MMIHFFSHRIVSILFVQDSVLLQTNLLNQIFYKEWSLYLTFHTFENSVSYLLNAVLRLLVLFSSSLQQMITLHLTIFDSRRNKSPVGKDFS